MTKAECRKHIKVLMGEHRQELPLLSEKALVALRANECFRLAKTVLLFHSLSDEVATHDFLHEVVKTKRVFLPVVRGEDMFVAEFEEESLHAGAFGIKEPLGTFYNGDVDVAVVPGVAFSPDGHRLGRGCGYYDRYLSQHSCYKIGLCFSFQCLATIPHEEHDVMMHDVITD